MTATEQATPEATTTPAWSGINHLALITADMDATVRFYHGVLGARLAATVGTPDFRHYFFEFGPQCTVAFFEYANSTIEPFAKPAGVPDPRAVAVRPPGAQPSRRGRTTRPAATASPKPAARSPTSSNTAASIPCTSPTTTASPSKRPAGSATSPADRPTTPTTRSMPIRIRCPRLAELQATGAVTIGPGTRLT